MQITGREHDMRCQRKGPSLVVSRFGRSYRSICIISDYCKIQLSLNRKSGTKKNIIYMQIRNVLDSFYLELDLKES